MSEAKPYPTPEPYARGRLAVGDGHELYWELSGNPDGRPAVFLHGGPGSGSGAHHRRLFDPARFNLLLFDQRGAGRSTPRGGLDANTTWHLVSDIERLREMVGAERWLVLGGSWGATLGLAYAQTHPERVAALILRGVFTGRAREVDWFYRGGGASLMFPDHWDEFVRPLDTTERADPVAAFHARLTNGDADTRALAAGAWTSWEGRLVSLLGRPAAPAARAGAAALGFATIENHYAVHRFWLEEGQLLRNADRLSGIPGAIVQGRFDVVTPPATAFALWKRWRNADFRMVEGAGHAYSEPGILSALVAAADRLADAA